MEIFKNKTKLDSPLVEGTNGQVLSKDEEGNNIWKTIEGFNVVDNLESTDSKSGLSANQGRVLNEKINTEKASLTASIETTNNNVDLVDGKVTNNTTNITNLTGLIETLTNRVNELENNEVVLSEEKIKGGTTVELNTSGYKRLLITCAGYLSNATNNGGTSTILTMDLTTKAHEGAGDGSITGYYAGMTLAYYHGVVVDYDMSVMCVVNSDKTTFTPHFGYQKGEASGTEDHYYISKIVGVK